MAPAANPTTMRTGEIQRLSATGKTNRLPRTKRCASRIDASVLDAVEGKLHFFSVRFLMSVQSQNLPWRPISAMSGLPSKQTSKRTSFLSVQCQKATSTRRSPHWRGPAATPAERVCGLEIDDETACTAAWSWRYLSPRGAEIAYQAPSKHSRTAATCCCADPGVASIASYRRNAHGDD
jgi:hypothetical protein